MHVPMCLVITRGRSSYDPIQLHARQGPYLQGSQTALCETVPCVYVCVRMRVFLRYVKKHGYIRAATCVRHLCVCVCVCVSVCALCRLVALSLVPRTPDRVQNFILQLPTDALSLLNVKFDFVLGGSGADKKQA